MKFQGNRLRNSDFLGDENFLVDGTNVRGRGLLMTESGGDRIEN